MSDQLSAFCMGVKTCHSQLTISFVFQKLKERKKKNTIFWNFSLKIVILIVRYIVRCNLRNVTISLNCTKVLLGMVLFDWFDAKERKLRNVRKRFEKFAFFRRTFRGVLLACPSLHHCSVKGWLVQLVPSLFRDQHRGARGVWNRTPQKSFKKIQKKIQKKNLS